jgi:hypothetical protein
MTSSSSGGAGLAALSSSYFTPQLRDRYDLPMPPPPEPKAKPASKAEASAVNLVA